MNKTPEQITAFLSNHNFGMEKEKILIEKPDETQSGEKPGGNMSKEIINSEGHDSNNKNSSEGIQACHKDILKFTEKDFTWDEPIETKPDIVELSNNLPQQNSSGTLPEKISYQKCLLCSNEYSFIEDVKNHLSIFHKIGSEMHSQLLQSRSFILKQE